MDSFLLLKCINPFDKSDHPNVPREKLLNFPISKREEYPSVPEKAKICVSCRFELFKSKPVTTTIICDDDYHKAGVAVLEKVKKKFSETVSKQERITLLTLAPEFWTIRDVVREFNCTWHEARTAKKLFDERGILSEPEKKKGKILPIETEILVKNFYENDNISRVMPGIKDFISVKKEDGTREHTQKRLLLGNLKEIYTLFQKENPDINIGFTKFTQLRPPHCVIAGSSGTHNVCVCVHHENIRLMFDNSNIAKSTQDTLLPLENVDDCIKTIVCSKPQEKCFLGDCLDCPNTRVLREHLLESFNKNDIFEITYDSWFQTDRCTIASKTVTTHEFVDLFTEKNDEIQDSRLFSQTTISFCERLEKKS